MANPFNADEVIREGFFINESERSLDPTDDVGKVVQLESDGKIANVFLRTPKKTIYFNVSSPATWTKPDNLDYIEVEVQAGGGNGGGPSINNANATGGGGGGGGYGKKKIEAASLGATETVIIGAVGGNSSFGTHVETIGGSAGSNGSTGTSGTVSPGGVGGTSTGGDINIKGQDGAIGVAGSPGLGIGGNSFLGIGGGSQGGSGTVGKSASGFGGGGGAGYGSGTPAGGAGTVGIVIVTEYYK